MGDTFHACHFHIVFSTKNRVPLLCVGLRERVWEHMAGVVRHKGANPILVGGHIDHVHMLVAIPPRLAPASIVQQVKGGTTHWVHESIGGLEGFAWQQGLWHLHHRDLGVGSHQSVYTGAGRASPNEVIRE
jgi:REP element-mobilizing transposase RayT